MLKLKYEKKEDIPAEVAHLYVEKDGTFELEIEGGVPDVQGLKSALESERKSNKETSESLKKAQAIVGDMDEHKIAELLKLQDQYKTAIAKTSEEMTNREKEIIKKWEKLDADKQAVIESLNDDVESHVVKSEINNVIATLKGDPEVLYDPIRKNIKVSRKEGGGFAFHVLDSDGKVRVGDNSGSDMTILQYGEEFKQKKGFASAFPTSTGGDAPGSKGNPGAKNSEAFNNLSPSQRLKIHREQNG